MTPSIRGRVALLWLRRDLRVHDNPALAAALASAQAVVPIFVLDPRLLDGPGASANRTWFLLGTLRALARDLEARGAPLVVRSGRPEDVIPAVAAEARAGDVFASRDVSPFARRRDAAVADALATAGRRLHLGPGLLVAEPEEVHTTDGRPVTVFAPFARRWAAVPRRPLLGAPSTIPSLPRGALVSDPLPVGPQPTADPTLLPVAGEAAARDRLGAWAASAALPGYADGRNHLDVDGTSRLSADLKFGTLSPLEVLLAAEGPGEGRRVFVSELAWREFYAHVLWHFPHVVRGAFRPRLRRRRVDDDPAGLAAWQAGRTGYPVVDAAMRQLAASGWMHNRARMIAASFLAKDLLIDWRRGEAHFMAQLLDGDVGAEQRRLAVDRGDGDRRRALLPGLQPGRRRATVRSRRGLRPALGAGAAGVPDAYLHEPWTMPAQAQRAAGCVIGRDYPAPLVDHAEARQRALAAYRQSRSSER